MAIKIKKGFVLRQIGPKYMAVPFGTVTNEVKGMISLTESSYLIWDSINKGVDTEEGLADVLCANYQVTKEDALKDVQEFIGFLSSAGVLEE